MAKLRRVMRRLPEPIESRREITGVWHRLFGIVGQDIEIPDRADEIGMFGAVAGDEIGKAPLPRFEFAHIAEETILFEAARIAWVQENHHLDPACHGKI